MISPNTTLEAGGAPAPVVAISIKQPWAWLIVNGHKPVENRDWHASYRGPVLIHAGLAQPDLFKLRDIADTFDVKLPALKDMAFGAFIGRAEIVDCVTAHDSPFFDGPFGFVLANPVAFARPLPFRGSLGLFRPKLTASQLQALG